MPVFLFLCTTSAGVCGRISFFEKAEAIKTLINLWYSRGALDLEDCSSNKALMEAICLGHCGYGWPTCELGGMTDANCYLFQVWCEDYWWRVWVTTWQNPVDEDGNVRYSQITAVWFLVLLVHMFSFLRSFSILLFNVEDRSLKAFLLIMLYLIY